MWDKEEARQLFTFEIGSLQAIYDVGVIEHLGLQEV